jgi:hypothetical protein
MAGWGLSHLKIETDGNRIVADMKLLISQIVFLAAFVAIAFPASLRADVQMTVAPDWTAPQIEIPSDFTGVSYETARVLPENDKYYFTDQNEPLIAMFQTLGVRSLRVGGNSVDKPDVRIPDSRDIDQLFAFAKEAHVKVIYGLRLKNQTGPDECALPAVKYIMAHYSSQLSCFGIGNEPTYYQQPGATYPYSSFVALFNKYISDLTAPNAVPNAVFAGPSASGSKPDWPRWSAKLADDDAGNPHVALISQHWYVGGSSRNVKDPAAARDRILSSDIIKTYETFAGKFVPTVRKDKLQFRIEETNTFSNAGAKDVSDTFASALWGLDYLYWWASQGAAGVNFHTGDKVAAGQTLVACNYSLFWSSPTGYNVHPLGYAMKAFTVAAQGRLVPLTVDVKDDANIRVYGVLSDNNDLCITIINKEHGQSGRDAAVTLSPGKAYSRGEVMVLACESHDISAKTGITLGGAPIDDRAKWDGKWTPLQPPSKKGSFTLTVPAASATIIRLADMRLVLGK